MKKGKWKRVVSMLFAVVMLLCALPKDFVRLKVKAAASDNTNVTYTCVSYGEPHSSNWGYILIPNLDNRRFQVMVYMHGMSGPDPKFPSHVQAYAEMWSNDEGIEPMIYVLPCIEYCKVATENSSKPYESFYQYYDFEKYIRYIFGNVLEDIQTEELHDQLKGKVDTSKGISVAGLSMGGAAALYAGCKYPDIVKNVGGLSPSIQLYQEYENFGMLIRDEDLNGIQYAQPDGNVNPVLYMSCSAVEEGGGHRWAVNNFMELFGNEYGFTKSVFKGGSHNHNLFFMELFCFVYMIQHDGAFPDQEYLKTVKYFDLSRLNEKVTYQYGSAAELSNESVFPAPKQNPEQPKDFTVSVLGDMEMDVPLYGKFDLEVKATGDNLTYRWQYSLNNKDWGDSLYNYTEAKLKVDKAIYTSYYHCIVSNGVTTKTTDSIKVNVGTKSQPNEGKNLTGTIKKSLTTGRPCIGDTVKVTVENSNCKNLQYRWYKSDGKTEQLVSSAQEYKVEASSLGYSLVCKVSDSSGNLQGELKANFDTVTARVTTSATDRKVYVGVSYTVSVPLNDQFKYRWEFSDNGTEWSTSQLTNSDTASIRPVGKAERKNPHYRCVITNGSVSVTTDEIDFVLTNR